MATETRTYFEIAFRMLEAKNGKEACITFDRNFTDRDIAFFGCDQGWWFRLSYPGWALGHHVSVYSFAKEGEVTTSKRVEK